MKKSTFVAMVLGTIGGVLFALGMCMVMVWEMLVPGVIVGLVGIIALMALIPLCKGLK